MHSHRNGLANGLWEDAGAAECGSISVWRSGRGGESGMAQHSLGRLSWLGLTLSSSDRRTLCRRAGHDMIKFGGVSNESTVLLVDDLPARFTRGDG